MIASYDADAVDVAIQFTATEAESFIFGPDSISVTAYWLCSNGDTVGYAADADYQDSPLALLSAGPDDVVQPFIFRETFIKNQYQLLSVSAFQSPALDGDLKLWNNNYQQLMADEHNARMVFQYGEDMENVIAYISITDTLPLIYATVDSDYYQIVTADNQQLALTADASGAAVFTDTTSCLKSMYSNDDFSLKLNCVEDRKSVV